MSGSDPMSSLNVSSDTIVPGGVGEIESARSRSSSGASSRQRSRKKAQGSGRRPITSIVKSLPKASSSSRGPSPAHRDQDSTDAPVEFHHHQELHVHDNRVQAVAIGVDPAEYGRMISEAQQLIDESQGRAAHFEGLSKEIYSQACQQVQQLVTMVQLLRQSCEEKDQSIQQLSNEVQLVQAQLQEQIARNQNVLSQLGSTESQTQRLLGHKDSEIARLMSEVSSLSSSKTRLEERLAALSAAPSDGQMHAVVEAQRTSNPVESAGLSLNDVQSVMSSQLAPLFEAFQTLSGRMDAFENQMSHNSTEILSEQPRQPQPTSSNVSFPAVPSSGLRLPLRPPGPPPDGGDDHDEGEDDEEEELVADVTPKKERDFVDSRALQNAKVEPVPNNASDYRQWKNTLILLMGRLDTSGEEALTQWLAPAFHVDAVKAADCLETSGLFPRLDRWLAGELIKSIKGLPELSFKVQAYVEGCTRKVEAPRGRAILNMVSRHFDLDRNRGALLTAQSVFQISLQGYSIKELQEFSSLAMRTLNSIPSEDWPNKRMLGEWLFHQLRNVRKLERTIDQIKRSDPLSHERDFSFLWERLQQLLVEEREDLNARAIEQSLKSPKKSGQPSNKTPAVPAKASPAGPSVSAAVSNPSPPPKKTNAKAPPAGKAKTSAKNLTPEQKAKTPCIFFQMPSGCIHGEKCSYAHVQSPPPAKAKTETDPKAKPKPKPKVAAAVAIVAALSSMVTPSQAIGSLEWAADSGAGRHLVSFEALREQGYHDSAFANFANESQENLRFSTGGGHKNSSQSLGFRDQGGLFGDANHFILNECPIVRSIGLDVEKNGLGFVWLPGSMPFYVRDPSTCEIKCKESNKFYASRVHQYVPFFRSTFDVIPGVPAEPFSADDDIDAEFPPDRAVEPVVVPEDILSGEPSVEPSFEPGAPGSLPFSEKGVLAPPLFEHMLTHFPKLSTCDVCNRARLYSKRVKSRRVVDEELDLPEPDAFGQQLACDHLIVFKSSKGKEHAVLIVQDRFSKVLQAYPTVSREAAQLASNLKHFVGLKSTSYTIVRSDAAGEILKAVIDNNWLPESSVPARFPHNSVLEREIRTFQEIARSVFLQAGFAARPQLWPQACGYVATAMSAFLKDPEGKTRWENAFGKEFLGPQYLLGQLGYVRTKDAGKFKFNPNAEPAIFVGWRLDFGMRYRGVLQFVLYSHLREDASSYPVSQFHDTEVYMPAEAVFPLASAAEAALKELDDPRLSELHDIDSVPVPFVDAEIKRKTRRVYVTYARMLKIGATAGCKGCENDTSAHNAECIARFEEAFGHKDADGSFVEPEVPVSQEIPAIEPMHVSDDFEYEPSIASNDPLDDDEVPECPPPSPSDDVALSDEDDGIRG